MTTRPPPDRPRTETGTGSEDEAATVPEDGVPRRRRKLVYALVASALLMIAIDQTSVATALSALHLDLGTSFGRARWTVSGYSVGQIIAFPLAGLLA